MSKEQQKELNRGPLAWFARNPVAANIAMAVLLIGGLLALPNIKQEVFPEFDLDLIIVNVPYPGSSPKEVEQGVLLAVEEAVRGLDDVKEVRATAVEGMGVLTIELLLGTDTDQALNDVKAAVDRITSFPENVERPTVFLARNRFEVVSLVIYGDADEKALRALGESTRDELLQDKRITFVELAGVRPLEVSVELPQRTLLEYGLTIEEVASRIRQASIELPAGGVKTEGGEILLRTDERRDRGIDYEDIAIVSRPDGTNVTLGELAEIRDGFADVDQAATFNGKPAVMARVFRSGSQTPIEVSAAVREYAENNSHRLPPGVQFATWFDSSEFYADRIDLLKRNAYIGLVLVLLVLGIFLEIKLAFWVTLGIPITFLGSLLFLPSTDVSINMISLFAFIIVLGMVVDDAIIVGEAIYKHRQSGKSFVEAAVLGVKEVAVPVCFAIVTTVFAYMPMLFVPGPSGKFFRVIPIVVIAVLALSLFESLFILPAHLAHSKKSRGGFLGIVSRVQGRFGRGIERAIDRYYVPVARVAVRNRWLTLAIGLATLLTTVGFLAGGRIQRTFLPRVEGDVIIATAELPFGASFAQSQALQQQMIKYANEILEENGGDGISRGIFAQVGAAGMASRGDPGAAGLSNTGSHLAEVAVYLVDAGSRDIGANEFSREWRDRIKSDTYGLDSLRFSFATGPQAGKAIHVELSHPDTAQLRAAATALAGRVEEFEGAYDIDDGYQVGKEQLDFELKPGATTLGISEAVLARQVRSAFFGAEAMRQQRGRDEIRTYVRLPKRERVSEYDVENLIIRTPGGGEVPLSQAATVRRGRAYTEIRRIDGRRAVTVTAEVDQSVASGEDAMAELVDKAIPEIEKEFPGVSYKIGGEEASRRESMGSLNTGWIGAVVAMFALLAIAFRSYSQPFIVLLAIPFGVVGAIWGHAIMGYSFSLMSIMGVVALSGVVVNDSLIMVVAINRYRTNLPLMEAVVAGCSRRFRPIILTSLTTFFGLAPMIVETSVQARFLIPMAISLGFGVMAATFITLLLVPAAYLVLEDFKRGFSRAWHFFYPPEPQASEASGQDVGV